MALTGVCELKFPGDGPGCPGRLALIGSAPQPQLAVGAVPQVGAVIPAEGGQGTMPCGAGFGAGLRWFGADRIGRVGMPIPLAVGIS